MNSQKSEWVKEIEEKVERSLIQPSFPFWLLLKLIWLEIRGKKVAKVVLHKPYTITFKNGHA